MAIFDSDGAKSIASSSDARLRARRTPTIMSFMKRVSDIKDFPA